DYACGETIRLCEIATSRDPNAERREESRRDRAEPRARIFFAVGFDVTLSRELGGKEAGIPPRYRRAKGDPFHARQLGDAAHRLAVEPGNLLRLPGVGHDRHVQSQHVPRVES